MKDEYKYSDLEDVLKLLRSKEIERGHPPFDFEKLCRVATYGESGRWWNFGSFMGTTEFAKEFIREFDKFVKKRIKEQYGY